MTSRAGWREIYLRVSYKNPYISVPGNAGLGNMKASARNDDKSWRVAGSLSKSATTANFLTSNFDPAPPLVPCNVCVCVCMCVCVCVYVCVFVCVCVCV